MFNSIRKIEFLRLLVLGLIPIFIFWPMFFGIDIGANDANLYHQFIADALEQYRQHIFPIYVGQSLYNFVGSPVAHAPYYFFLVGFINLISFGKLTSLQIQHVTVIFSALVVIYLTYFLLTKIVPKYRWIAASFAIFYLTCPGILGLIVRMDMYYSFMAVPFVPLYIYALVRIHQKNDLLSFLLLSVSLALLLMAHPDIAGWCVIVGVIYFTPKIFFQPKIMLGLTFSLLIFVLLSLWQLTTVFSLKLNFPSPDSVGVARIVAQYSAGLIAYYKENYLNFLKPVNLEGYDYSSFLQLGYSLWLSVLIGLMVAIKTRDNLLKYLMLCVAFLVIVIFPIPYLSQFFWSHVTFYIITLSAFVVERIYVILAALSCFIGVLFLSRINFDKNKITKISISICLILALGWSLFQATSFTKYLTHYLSYPSSWTLPENAKQRVGYDSSLPHERLLEGIYEPALFNRLLNRDGQEISGFNNKEIMDQICSSNTNNFNNTILENEKFPALINSKNNNAYISLIKLKIQPEKKYMLCVGLNSFKSNGIFEIKGDKHYTLSFFDSINNSQKLFIPIFTTEDKEKNLEISLIGSTIPGDGKININSMNVVSYNPSDLPIKLLSLTPYKVSVNNPETFAFLETPKEFMDGYVAYVNGKKQPVRVSSTGRIMVPLNKGNNELVLIYQGTTLMRMAFLISLLSWILVAIYFMKRFLK